MEQTPIVTVNIRNIAVGGDGVGEVCDQADGQEHLRGITAFVPFTIKGEQVSAQVLQQKDRFLKTQLLEVLSPSTQRVHPECKYFTVCGGCELQHLNYQGQLVAKLEMMLGALKAARVNSSIIDLVKPIVPSDPYGYRRRITLHVDSSGRVGFYRSNSRSVVPIQSCPVAVPAIEKVLESIQDFGRLVQGKISSILLEADNQGLVAVIKSPYALALSEKEMILATARQYFENVVLMAGEEEIGGFGRQILELPLAENSRSSIRLPAGYFSQINWEVNLQLIENVLKHSFIKQQTEIFDLFAGAGNFSIPLAKAGATVTAVEADQRLVTLGQQSIVQHGLEKQLRFVNTSVENFLLGLPLKTAVGTIIADPPRSGLGNYIESLRIAKKLILISCHLPSFVRDLKNLVSFGWNVKLIQPYDMFAQTSYLEIFSVFQLD